jgi:hypothetical protein
LGGHANFDAVASFLALELLAFCGSRASKLLSKLEPNA